VSDGPAAASSAAAGHARPQRKPAGHAVTSVGPLVPGAVASDVTSGATSRPPLTSDAVGAPATQPAAPAPADDQGPAAPSQAPGAPVNVGQGAAGAVPDTWTPDVGLGVDRFPHHDASVPPSRPTHVDIWPG
jgi:hypothetical protein